VAGVRTGTGAGYRARMTTTRTERITAPDGGLFDGHLAVPELGSGPGLLLIQEIGGVNGYIREVAARLAALGYVVLAPDAFWRVRPNYELEVFTPEGLGEAMGIAGQFDPATGVPDLAAALDHLRTVPEVTGGVGVIGFCFGGTMSYLLAAAADPAVAVSYYGSGVAGALDHAPSITCPILFHFGGADPYLPAEDVERIRAATAAMANAEILVQPDAGHAFDNHLSEVFSDPEAAVAAWGRTVSFLAEHLPVSS